MLGVTDLVKSISIENIINQRAQVGALVMQAHELLQQASVLAEAAHMGPIEEALAPRYFGDNINFGKGDGATELLRKLDGPLWQYLMEESGLLTFMDHKAREEWQKSIREHTYPPFSYETVKQTFGTLYTRRGEMFERGLIEIYKGLSWDYKTNQPFKFGRRIILRGFSYGYIYHSGMDRLDDLHRIFCVLDGKQEPDYRDGVGSEIRRIHIHDKAGCYDGTYLGVRWFKKGTAHVTLKRQDLVLQCNRMLARHYPNALAATNIDLT